MQEVHAADAAGGGDSRSRVKVKLSEDKALYNAFQNKFRKSPQQVQDAFSEVKATNDPDNIFAWMKDLIAQTGNYSAEYLARIRTTKK